MAFKSAMANRMNVLLTFVRHQHSRKDSKHWRKDAFRFEQVKYYPCNKDFKDPPITPAKVFMVERIRPFSGNPWWDKDMLLSLGFVQSKYTRVFVKNTPEMCAKLWKIKHLIKITPVKLPEKLPIVDELSDVYVNDFGTLTCYGKLDPVRYEATVNAQKCPKRLAYSTISEKLRLQWVKGNLI
ncbi:39S ribosomal protein L30, mitochondrial [Hylaeus anthracinus]|uniref:39S ribosomal protein L30, mitochondrial n=1 Tax=Hylaeus anthracinus TaxID=313031 RepID=UPI0023B98176|nr:39S ribosomal protein L30, mitochondrial [Hylaeus anthracinus]